MKAPFDDDSADFGELLRRRINRTMDPLISACRACGLSPTEGVAALALASYGLAMQIGVDFDGMIAAVKATKMKLGPKVDDSSKHQIN